ncbi:MAG: aldo/keto reductase, partial [Pseudomonadota bacterium]
FGGAPLGNLLAPLSDATAEATLQASWDAGMRWFDTAPLYGLGLSEERVGRFFRGAARGEATISTKVGRVLEDCAPEDATPDKFIDVPSRRFDFDYGYDGVMRSHEQSLARMGVEAVDVLFCHDVDVFTHGSEAERDRRIKAFLDGGLRAMLELREQGAVKAIGAGINEWQAARLLAEAADVDVFLLAGRYTLLEQTALESFLPFCERRGIGILLGGPFNSGVLATGAVEGALYDYAPAPPEVLARVARIERVCAAHGVALPAAALRFPLAHPQVFSIIPGTRTPEETARAVETLQADIPAGLWSDLRAEGLIREDAPTPEAAS